MDTISHNVWALSIQLSKCTTCKNSKLKKNTFKIHLYHLPNISNIFNIVYLIFQIYHITNHLQFFFKQIQYMLLPLTKESKDFQHFAFNFPNLTHHKPFTIFQKNHSRFIFALYQPNQIFSIFCIQLSKFSISQTNHHF